MVNLSGVVEQLKKERGQIEKQLAAINAALAAFVGVYSNGTRGSAKRNLSAEGRRRISLAQKARWAKATPREAPKVGKVRVMSAAARRKIAAAQRARWAKVKARKATNRSL